MTDAPARADFLRAQYAFAAHIRDPQNAPRPADVDERRMEIYRALFYNNMESMLSSSFPVIRSLLDDERWHDLVRDFFIRHRCHTPHFPEIPQEFIAYLQQERHAPEDPAFLVELAHYEWIELDVSLDDGAPPPHMDPNGDLLGGVPVMAPVVRNLSYHYPVHRISRDYQPSEPGSQPTRLVVYRDRLDEVRFLEINAVTQRLLALMKENTHSRGLDLLRIITDELQSPKPDAVIRAGAEVLADLRQRNILLGTLAA